MKHPNKLKLLCASAATAIGLSDIGTTQAQVISWNFDQYGFVNAGGGTGVPVPNSQAGVVPAYNWNDSWSENFSSYAYGTPITVNNLYDNSGATTTASVSYNSYNGYHITSPNPGQDADGTYNRDLLNGFLNAGPATWSPPATSDSVSLTAIPYAQYNIYVYVSDDTAGRLANISNGSLTYDLSTMGLAAISGATATFVQSTDTSGANPTADYVVFSGLTGSSQTITVSAGDQNPADAAWVGLAGFQVVAVPEPGSMPLASALAGLGSIGFLLFKRPAQKS
jgi:hypothetical protein